MVASPPAQAGSSEGQGLDELERWFTEQAATPVGSILLFTLVFLTRVAMDHWTTKRREKKARKRKSA